MGSKLNLKSAYKSYIDGRPVETMTLDIEREYIDTTCLTEPDPDWTFTDAAGHFHAMSKKRTYPTLERQSKTVEGSGRCCDDKECDTYYDDSYTDVWLECVLCHERIVPGSRTGQPSHIPGPMSWSLTISGVWIEPEQRVNIRIDREGKPVMFGIAECMRIDIGPGNQYTADLIGVGELGCRG